MVKEVLVSASTITSGFNAKQREAFWRNYDSVPIERKFLPVTMEDLVEPDSSASQSVRTKYNTLTQWLRCEDDYVGSVDDGGLKKSVEQVVRELRVKWKEGDTSIVLMKAMQDLERELELNGYNSDESHIAKAATKSLIKKKWILHPVLQRCGIVRDT
jgi:hypothetical protein